MLEPPIPQTGGAYTRCQSTGELTLETPPTQPADAGFFTPIESEVAGVNQKKTVSRKD
ncbi:hypothetical protein R6242_14330 [Iodobacter sp. CM08]|uniref:hypothetical protein n=1 Tax=Iodobacter sp. CM08 TaxID=3085902 RepID=UPI00298265F5|nr:hypothetical protein [Iodobacter sp. CM08]MDW5417744.1 hypothetical protein [Iodobacter sp. CM08]